MIEVNITELRNHMHDYMCKVQEGEELLVISRGKAVARLVPTEDEFHAVRDKLGSLRKKCRIGDVISPIDESWEVDPVHS